jgi:enoyl-CoA hydratase/carnithine racemase
LNPHIRTEAAAGIGRLILDRPEKRNAISCAMWQAIPNAVAKLDADPTIRVIILQGAGEHFAAGADIAEFDEVYATSSNATAYAADLANAMTALTTCKTPTIAAIRGVCVGGGVALSLCCDLRIAEEGARFAITPAKLGIAYSFEDTRRLVAQVGPSAAKDLLFSARMLPAEEALHIRLIDRLFPAGTLEENTLAYARTVAANSPATISVARDFITLAADGQTGETDHTTEAYLNILEGPDFTEGKSAFAQKRPPLF